MKEYYEQMRKYHFEDNEEMRKRWKTFTEHRKKCRAEAQRMHRLFAEDRTAWRAELTAQGKTPAEITAAETRELRKTEALRKLNR